MFPMFSVQQNLPLTIGDSEHEDAVNTG